jgi:GPI-anchor transamidase subunit U
MIGVIFRPPSTLYELNIGLCWMMFSPQSIARMSLIIVLVSFGAIPVTVCLYIVSYSMWIGPNTGEVNFVYFQCLAYNIFISLLFLMFCSSSIRRDKALRITEKDLVNKKMKQS